MPRSARAARGGALYHVFNRGNLRSTVFSNQGDYRLFEEFLQQAQARVSMRVLSYCLMPNHWHMVLWPRRDPDLGRFLGWLAQVHTQWWHLMRGTVGTGHLYQGRYGSVEIQDQTHFLDASRYVERNPLTARLVDGAEEWRWGSLWKRSRGDRGRLLAEWPVPRPADWLGLVNTPRTDDEFAQGLCRPRPNPVLAAPPPVVQPWP